MISALWQFFRDNFPPPAMWVQSGPPLLVWAALCLTFSGRLKRDRKWPTGYTRKVFHFLIFFSAAVLHWQWGLRMVCLFGTVTGLIVFFAIFRGQGHLWYEALAREKDAPHRTYFIVVPFFATLMGGVAANLLFADAAIAGYLVTAVGDAVGEPVGVRFGVHSYRVPALRKGTPTTRTLEGSLAVFLASLAMLALFLALRSGAEYTAGNFLILCGISVIAAVAEAASPHGWDNLTMQILPAGMVCFWL